MSNTTAATGEQVLMTLRTHPKVLFAPVLAQIALIVVHILVIQYFPHDTGVALINEWGQQVVHGLIVMFEFTYAILPALRWWNARFIVTDKRLQEHWGVLYKHVREIPLNRIASVSTERGILDRIFGCGTLIFHDAGGAPDAQTGSQSVLSKRSGEGNVGIRFHDVGRVHEVRQQIDAVRFPA